MHTRQHIIGAILLVLALGIAGGSAAYMLRYLPPELALDADNCPATPPGSWLAFIDGTDPWGRTEQVRIVNGLVAIAERMEKHERLALHRITALAEDAYAPWPLPALGFADGFRRCKSTPTRINPLIENETLERADYERTFLTPLKKVGVELSKGARAQQSPILEAIEAAFSAPHFRPSIAHRTLVLFSDLLAHSSSLSHLTRALPSTCAVLASQTGQRLTAHDWRGVRVILIYLHNPRDAARQGPAHLKWWASLLYQLGAVEVFDDTQLIANDTTPCAADNGKSPRPRSSNSKSAHGPASIFWR